MRKRIKRQKAVKENCIFCKTETQPDYKEVEKLKVYLSERGKIIGKSKTGLCTRHQRFLTREVKHARYIGLLPFIVKPS